MGYRLLSRNPQSLIKNQNFAEACRILGGDWVIEAAKFYRERNDSRTESKTVEQVVFEFLEAKKTRQQSEGNERGLSPRYLQDLRYRCGKFAEHFKCDIDSITAAQIEDFLNGMSLSPRSYINFRRVLNTLFEFAKRRSYLPRDNQVIDQVERLRDAGGDIEIYKPVEMARLLKAADRDFLTCLALGGFAGLRSSEIERLTWADIDLSEGFIEIKRGKTKTKTRRIVPITKNLAKWLKDCGGSAGQVWPHGHDSFYDAQQETVARSEDTSKKPVRLKWRANALRHSFISYRLAEIQNLGTSSDRCCRRHSQHLPHQANSAKWVQCRHQGTSHHQ
ncbi:site-specific integrase [bacterium]|nr:site-specific integrase [bacterium]